MRLLTHGLSGVAGATIVVLASSFGFLVLPDRLAPDQIALQLDLSYSDFLTVMFAGATLTLAALAIMVGVVAFYTYQGIKAEATRSIENAVTEATPELYNTVQKQIQGLFEEKAKELDGKVADFIQQSLVRAGRDGTLDEALQRALISINMGFLPFSQEVDEDPDEVQER